MIYISLSPMSRKLIWIATVLMGLAMMSLIIFQVIWIRSAFSARERQFDQIVKGSLLEIARQVEWNETERLVNQQMEAMTADSGSALRPFSGGDHERGGVVTNNSFRGSNRRGIPMNDQDLSPEQRDFFSNQEVLVYRVIMNRLRLLDDIEDRIDQDELLETIRSVFEENGIGDMDFEYAVVKPDNTVAMQSPSFSLATEAENFKVEIFPNDLIPNMLSVYFPQRKDSRSESVGYMAYSAVILSLIIVLTFALTVYILFRQKKLSDIRNDFVSNMTHELKTPISTISLAAQMLGDKSIAHEVKNPDQISKIISDECRRLGSQVEKVLQTAIFDKGKLKLRLQETDMHEMINNAIENFSIQIRSRNGKIGASLKARNAVIEADQVHMNNVLSNLIDNAIKYCTRDPEIMIETADQGPFFTMTVKDNGIGISKNDQKRIFEKFYRVPTGNIHTVKGFGLGLSYVRMIVEEHQGRIDLESEMYEGTRFIILLPVKAKQ